MKNLKTLLFMLISTCSIHAQYKMEEGQKASKPTNQWKFELSNKSKNSITVSAYHQHGNQKIPILDSEHIIPPKSKLRIANLKNKRWDTILNLSYTKNNKEKHLTITFPAAGEDKQILVKFENDLIMPQLGTLAGAGGKTTSGIVISNNIQESEIMGNDQELIREKIVDNLFN